MTLNDFTSFFSGARRDAPPPADAHWMWDEAPTALVGVAADGALVAANRAARELLGLGDGAGADPVVAASSGVGGDASLEVIVGGSSARRARGTLVASRPDGVRLLALAAAGDGAGAGRLGPLAGRIEAVFAGLAEGITVQSSQGELVYANDAAARVMGFEDADALLRAPAHDVLAAFDVLDEDGAPLPLDRLPGRLALRGEPAPERVVRFRRRSTGEERWARLGASPVLDASGRVAFAVNLFRDVTERRRDAERQRLLGQASEILSASLDYATTLESVVRLMVPRVADWCAVHVRGDDDAPIGLVAVAHADPEKEALARHLHERYPPDPAGTSAVATVLREGRPLVVRDVSPALVDSIGQDEEHRRILRGLGLRSLMILPLEARGRTFGTVSLVFAESGRRYEERDLAFARDLARRAALAVDNARLYGEREDAEERLGDLVHTLDGIVWEADADPLRFTFVSARAEAILGYPASVWVDDPDFWASRLHPSDREWVTAFCVTETAAARDHEFEYRMIAADGRVVWLRDVVRVVRDAAGRAARLRGLMLDVTARKLAERRLSVQHAVTSALAGTGTVEAAWRTVLKAVGHELGWELGAYWRVDEGDDVLRAEATWVAEHVAADDFAAATRAATLRCGEGIPGRVWASGEARWVRDLAEEPSLPRAAAAARDGLRSGIAFPVLGGDRLLGVLEFFSRDAREPDAALTEVLSSVGSQLGLFIERRLAEDAMRASEARKGAILEAALDAILTIDHEGRIIEFNPAAEALFGRSREDAIGRIMGDIIVPERFRDAHSRGHARYLATGEAHVLGKRLELPALRKDGTEFTAEVAIVRNPGDGPPTFTGFLRDITDRKRAEETTARLLAEIDDQRRRLDAIVASVPGVVWEAWGEPDAATQRIDYVSPHVERMLGYTTQEWLAVPNFWLSVVHPEDRERAARESLATFRSGKPGVNEFRWVAKDGRVLWVQAHAIPVHDESGRPIGMRGVTTDITDRKRMEEALRESHERFRLLARATSDIVWDRDVGEGTIWWNENFHAMFGYPRNEIGDDPASWADRIHPEERDRVVGGLDAALAGGARTWQDEYRFRRKDGTYASILDRGFVLRGPGGRARRMVGSMMDVTDRVDAERALRDSESRYRAMAEAAPQQVWTALPDGRLDYVNRRVLDYFGRTFDEMIGDGWQGVIHPDDAHGVLERWRRSLESGEPYEVEFRLRRADGEYRSHIGRAVAHRDEAGRVVKWFGSNTDITDRIDAEAALKESEHRYAQILDSVQDMVFCKEADLRVAYANKAACDYYGMSVEEIRGVVDGAHNDPAHTAAYLADDRRVFETGRTVEVLEEPNRRADGEIRVFHTIKSPVFDRHGNVVQLVGVSRDITEHKRAEARLRESEARYRLLAENASDMITTVDAGGTLLYVSPSSRGLLGYEPRDLRGTRATDLLHPEDRERIERAQAQLLESGGSYSVQARMLRRDGEYVWVETTARRAQDPATGVVREVVAVTRDITDRKLAEEETRRRADELARLASELAYQNRLTQTIMDNAASALFMMDGNGYPVFMNRAASALTGYASVDEIKGRPLHYAVHFKRSDGSPYPMEECPIDQANERIIPLRDQREIFCRKDGTLFPVRYNVAPVERDGVQLGAVLDVRDVTEDERRERALREQARTLATLNRVNATLAAELDPERLVQAVTDAATELTGAKFGALFYNVKDARGGAYTLYTISGVPKEAFSRFPMPRATDLFGPTFRGEGIIRLDDVTQDARYGRNAPHRGMPEGHLPVRSYLAVPVVSRYGEVIGGLFFGHPEAGVFSEQSEQFAAGIAAQAAIALDNASLYQAATTRAEELQRLADALERSNRELDQFAYVASHDLKAPLRGIANLSRWLEEDLGDRVPEEARQHLDLLRGRVNRMEGLIDAILEYSRVGRVRAKAEPVPVGDVLRDVIDLLSPPPTFSVEVEPGMPTVLAERSRLQQVFLNLVGNAIKHHDRLDGSVRVGVRDAGRFHEFSVTDDGPGISPRFHDKVFVIFQTLEARDKKESTGVGLALVKKIVESQGGAVTLESDEGKGATFRFTWPKSPEADDS